MAAQTVDNWVSAADIGQLVNKDSNAPWDFQPQRAALQQPLLRGSFRFNEVRPGLVVHSTDAHELQDLRSQAETPGGVSLVMVLGGKIDVSFGRQRLMLAAPARGGQGAASAAVVVLTETDRFERRSHAGGYSRKVSLSMSPEWLEQSGLGRTGHRPSGNLQRFLRQHLMLQHWTPSAQAMALAQQIIEPSPYADALQLLHLECRAIGLITEAFARLDAPGDGAQQPRGLSPLAQRRMARALELLQTDPQPPLSVSELARQVGTNATTLQKQFRAVHGTTVFEFLREQRLQRAHAALFRDGIPVAAAAELAGYTSAANFATAYRRRFGAAPSQTRTTTRGAVSCGVQIAGT